MNGKKDVLGELKNAWKNMKDPEVQTWKKATAIGLAGAYVLSPVDLIPDFIPVVGQIDDIAITYLIAKGFNKIAEHKKEVPSPQKEESIFEKLEKYKPETQAKNIEREL